MTENNDSQGNKLFALNLTVIDRESNATQAFLSTPDGKSMQEGLSVPLCDMWARSPKNRYVVLYTISGHADGGAVHFGAASELSAITTTAFALADWACKHSARAHMRVHLDGEEGKRLQQEFTLRSASVPESRHSNRIH